MALLCIALSTDVQEPCYSVNEETHDLAAILKESLRASKAEDMKVVLEVFCVTPSITLWAILCSKTMARVLNCRFNSL